MFKQISDAELEVLAAERMARFGPERFSVAWLGVFIGLGFDGLVFLFFYFVWPFLRGL